MALGKHELPNPHYRRCQLLMEAGRVDDAQALVDALNAFNKAFGMPLFELPPPLGAPLPNLVTCPAKGGPIEHRR